jgi:hypothetical protein
MHLLSSSRLHLVVGRNTAPLVLGAITMALLAGAMAML